MLISIGVEMDFDEFSLPEWVDFDMDFGEEDIVLVRPDQENDPVVQGFKDKGYHIIVWR